MSDTMINMKILRKCGGELEHAIKSRFVEPHSTEDYINAMEDIITRTRIANTCTQKTTINGIHVIEEVQCTEEKQEFDQDSAVSEDTPLENYPMENITAFFEVTEVHTHLPQYSEDSYNLINIQDARMCKTIPARGKGYTAGASGKDYLQVILPEWQNHLLPIGAVQFSSASNNMYPLDILHTNIVFPHPAGGIGIKTEIVAMDNCTSQHIILGNDYLNIYGIDINNSKDRYFTIGENKRQKFAFSNVQKQISIVSSKKDTYKEEFLANQLVEAQIYSSLSPKMRNELDDMLYTYNNAFASDNEPLGAIKDMKLILLLILTDHILQYVEDQVIQPVSELEKPWKTYPRVNPTWCTMESRP
ncbi:hypothetical protein O181_093160 [Austropuccinia psidii MF-1]|uniref:Uncharacterized protein n=1 Tax=Austropuccinia psidii MF-1 TaxID=1389203 RepID=A0A9Q3P9U1_9BASI|nr:hypothetical protein [Austropuccinia psidii MF-1]